MPTKNYVYDLSGKVWRRHGSAPIAVTQSSQPSDPTLYRPVSYATLAEARTALNAPSDANYVMWSFGSQDLETVFTSLGANDILVLPERAEPYWIDSSKGFMAANVKEIDGTGPDGMKDGSRVPIVHNPRLWFSMARARRGIIGLGPGAVIMPTDSGFTAPRQPILQNEPDKTMLRYMLDGTTAAMNGVANSMLETEHDYPFYGNFTMRGRSFGGVAYTGLAAADCVQTVVKRIYFDGSWRGHAGIPNGETAGLGFLRGAYLVENCEFRSDGGPSPIMWNRNTGGAVRHVKSSRPNYGMWTFWRCGGTNTFEDVWMDCGQVGINLEENLTDFQLDWTGGKMMLDYTGNKFHFGINPSGGSIKIALHNVEVSPNAYTPNMMTANIYTTSGVQRRSDVTCDTRQVSYVPAANWID